MRQWNLHALQSIVQFVGLSNHRVSVDYQPSLIGAVIAPLALFIQPVLDFPSKVFVWIQTARHLVNAVFVKGRMASEFPLCLGMPVGPGWVIFRIRARDFDADIILGNPGRPIHVGMR